MNKKAIFLLLAISATLIISCSINDEKGKTKDLKSDVPRMAKMETRNIFKQLRFKVGYGIPSHLRNFY